MKNETNVNPAVSDTLTEWLANMQPMRMQCVCPNCKKTWEVIAAKGHAKEGLPLRWLCNDCGLELTTAQAKEILK